MSARRAHPSERRRHLDRNEIIAISLEALDGGTLDELSMRALAQRLGVTPMALYTHVADKDDILDALLDHALRRDAAPPPAPSRPSDWRPWLVAFANSLRELLVRHPALLDRYLRAPVGVPAAVDRMEAAFKVLADAGHTDDDAVSLYAAVHTLTLGFTALEVARRRAASTTPRRSERLQFDPRSPGYWPAYFGALPDDTHAHLRRIRPDLATFTEPDRLVVSVGRLLESWSPAAETPRKARKR